MLLQVLYVFPNSGPQLLMMMSMLGDLGYFLLMIVFFLISFSCAFVVLLYRGADDYVDIFFDRNAAWNVFHALWRAQLKCAHPRAQSAQSAPPHRRTIDSHIPITHSHRTAAEPPTQLWLTAPLAAAPSRRRCQTTSTSTTRSARAGRASC